MPLASNALTSLEAVKSSLKIPLDVIVDDFRLEGLINQPGKTVGIITFNSKQQAKIQDVIEKMLTEDEQFRDWWFLAFA